LLRFLKLEAAFAIAEFLTAAPEATAPEDEAALDGTAEAFPFPAGVLFTAAVLASLATTISTQLSYV
jgi:hypothetical protein